MELCLSQEGQNPPERKLGFQQLKNKRDAFLTGHKAATKLWAMEHAALQPGQIIARGVVRYLRSLDYISLLEFSPTRGRRVDVAALGPKGEIWVIECKSSRADFQTDTKWQDYLEWCDRFYFAVPPDFPVDILPENHGLIFADGYGAEIIREAAPNPVPAARRKKLTLKLARDAALRLTWLSEATGRYAELNET